MKRGDKLYLCKDKNEIPLTLNSYEDLFSGFDPRDYSKKAISKDFLSECKNAAEDKIGEIKLSLFLPRSKRDSAKENEIKNRLKEHFLKHFLEKKKELFNIRAIGAIWFATGCILTAITAIFMEFETSLSMRALINIAHPAGWFFLWEGLAKILIHSKEKKEDYAFNKKLKNSKISFLNS